MAETDNNNKKRADRNRTITLQAEDIYRLKEKLLWLDKPAPAGDLIGKTIHQDLFEVINYLPTQFVDLLFIDPPYNLTKKFNSNKFKEMSTVEYEQWLESWLAPLGKILKSTASIYICGDWKSTGAIFNVMSKYFKIRNRITWEREKGRGAKTNWKNCSEDIWYGTVSGQYTFNADAVMLKKKVIAPYRNADGQPRDWEMEINGNYRLTHPSNFWTDITVPFWSMPENTDHPTQKPEKLMAKIILSSSNHGDVVFDPFLGSGSTSVVAKKLGRNYCGVELDELYCCLAEKRLELADNDCSVQGYTDGKFWERNTLNEQKDNSAKKRLMARSPNLFDAFQYGKQLI